MIGAADGAIAGDSVVRAAGDGVLPRRTAGDSVTGDAGGCGQFMECDELTTRQPEKIITTQNVNMIHEDEGNCPGRTLG